MPQSIFNRFAGYSKIAVSSTEGSIRSQLTKNADLYRDCLQKIMSAVDTDRAKLSMIRESLRLDRQLLEGALDNLSFDQVKMGNTAFAFETDIPDEFAELLGDYKEADLEDELPVEARRFVLDNLHLNLSDLATLAAERYNYLVGENPQYRRLFAGKVLGELRKQGKVNNSYQEYFVLKEFKLAAPTVTPQDIAQRLKGLTENFESVGQDMITDQLAEIMQDIQNVSISGYYPKEQRDDYGQMIEQIIGMLVNYRNEEAKSMLNDLAINLSADQNLAPQPQEPVQQEPNQPAPQPQEPAQNNQVIEGTPKADGTIMDEAEMLRHLQNVQTHFKNMDSKKTVEILDDLAADIRGAGLKQLADMVEAARDAATNEDELGMLEHISDAVSLIKGEGPYKDTPQDSENQQNLDNQSTSAKDGISRRENTTIGVGGILTGGEMANDFANPNDYELPGKGDLANIAPDEYEIKNRDIPDLDTEAVNAMFDLYADYGIDEHMAAPWLREGFDHPEDAVPWMDNGINAPEVKSWAGLGFGSTEAGLWKKAGTNAHLALDLKMDGLTPQQALAERDRFNLAVRKAAARANSLMKAGIDRYESIRQAAVENSVDNVESFARLVEQKVAEHYPWDQCIKDQKAAGHSQESAEKICGSIKAKNSSRKVALKVRFLEEDSDNFRTYYSGEDGSLYCTQDQSNGFGAPQVIEWHECTEQGEPSTRVPENVEITDESGAVLRPAANESAQDRSGGDNLNLDQFNKNDRLSRIIEAGESDEKKDKELSKDDKPKKDDEPKDDDKGDTKSKPEVPEEDKPSGPNPEETNLGPENGPAPKEDKPEGLDFPAGDEAKPKEDKANVSQVLKDVLDLVKNEQAPTKDLDQVHKNLYDLANGMDDRPELANSIMEAADMIIQQYTNEFVTKMNEILNDISMATPAVGQPGAPGNNQYMDDVFGGKLGSKWVATYKPANELQDSLGTDYGTMQAFVEDCDNEQEATDRFRAEHPKDELISVEPY